MLQAKYVQLLIRLALEAPDPLTQEAYRWAMVKQRKPWRGSYWWWTASPSCGTPCDKLQPARLPYTLGHHAKLVENHVPTPHIETAYARLAQAWARLTPAERDECWSWEP